MREVARTTVALPRRYLGLELAGAKNEKTAIAALEFYPREQKVFLLDIYDRIAPTEDQTGDECLLEVLDELKPGVARMGVNVPLTLPPCISCTREKCPCPGKTSSVPVKWMRAAQKRAEKTLKKKCRVRPFTPYTQRPVELWVRYHLFPELWDTAPFEIDEALGGNKAPLTARMHFLKRQIPEIELVEVWPKLSVAIVARELAIHKRMIESYRHLERGAHARSEILEKLAHERGIFIYERDLRKLSQSLTAFDAFICAYTALLSDTDQCAKVPHGFPVASGWVEYPRTERG